MDFWLSLPRSEGCVAIECRNLSTQFEDICVLHLFGSSITSLWTKKNFDSTRPQLLSYWNRSNNYLYNFFKITFLTLTSFILLQVSPHLEWNIIPKLWSKMESLSIMQSTSLSMAMVVDLVPQLGRLKRLTLPKAILLDEERSSNYKFIEESANRCLPIRLIFTSSEPRNPCQIVPTSAKKRKRDAQTDV